METALLTVVGLIVGGFITFFVTKKFIHRPKLEVSLTSSLILFPDELNLQPTLQMSIAGRPVPNLCVMHLTITNHGSSDIVVPDAQPPRGPNATPPPRFEFDGFKVLAIRTLNNDASKFNVPLGLDNQGQRMFLNINRIKAQCSAKFQLVGTLTDSHRSFTKDRAHLFPGAIQNCDVELDGLISDDTLTN